MNKLGLKCKSKVAKAIAGVETFVMGLSTAMTASASGVTIKVDDSASMEGVMGNVVGFMCSIARYIGIGLLVYGAIQLYMSFKDENPDGKIKAISFCVVAIGLISIKTALKLMGIIA